MSKSSKPVIPDHPSSAPADKVGYPVKGFTAGERWFRPQPAGGTVLKANAGGPFPVADEDVPPVRPSAYEAGPRARALLAGIRAAERDLRASGGAFTLDEVREVLRGVSRQRVEQRVREGSLLAVPGPSNHRRYPAAQFGADGEVVAGLAEVTSALPTKNPWAILNFLVNPDVALDGRRPIDLLSHNDVEPVVAAARSLGTAGR